MNRYCYSLFLLLILVGPTCQHALTQALRATPNEAVSMGQYIPLKEFTINEIISRVGRTPSALVSFFESNFAKENYSGSLRGPRSVLITKASNSLDGARFLSTLLRSAGHQTRVVMLDTTDKTFIPASRVPSAPRPQNAASSELPGVLDQVAATALLVTMGLGDCIHADCRLGTAGPSIPAPPTPDTTAYGVQLLEGGTWRTIHGGAYDKTLWRGVDLSPMATKPVELTLDFVYDTETGTTVHNALRARLDQEDVAFRPLWLDFAVSGGSAHAVLHLPDTTISGSDIPIVVPGGPPHPWGKLQDVRLTIVGGHPHTFNSSFSLKPPSTAIDSKSQAWKGTLLKSVHSISIVTGTPSIDYLVLTSTNRLPMEKQSYGEALNAFNLMYFALRALFPASPDRPAAIRVINGPNVLTTSVYEDGQNKSEVAINLARKNYEISIVGASTSFGEQMWNGFLDRGLESLMVRLMTGASLDLDFMLPESDQQPRFTTVRQAGDLMPFALSTAQIDRLRARLAAGVIVAYPENAVRGIATSVYWELERDGMVEDWDQWDRHSQIEEGFLNQIGRAIRENLGTILQCVAVFALSASAPRLNADPTEAPVAEVVETALKAITEKEKAKCKQAAANRLVGSKGGLLGEVAEKAARKPWWKK
jgi:hypothetical protein